MPRKQISKIDALRDIIVDVHNKRPSNTSAQRIVRAGRALGLTEAELLHLMQFMDYADFDTGEPYSKNITRTW